MKIKKILIYLGIILALILVIILGWLIERNKKIIKKDDLELIPEQEISEEQIRQTIVTLYFCEKDSAKIEPEARKIDAKLLVNNPYKVLIDLLIEGPKNKDLIKIIPEGTKLNNVELKNSIAYIDFSFEFIENQYLGAEKEKIIVEALLKTLSELNEINGIKININGEENSKFPDEALSLSQIFYIK